MIVVKAIKLFLASFDFVFVTSRFISSPFRF